MIAIVGAGLAGLAAARCLLRKGVDFVLLEANDGPGGRVRSLRKDGFTLDLGFQIILDSYSAVVEHVDLSSLQPRYFDSGALIWDQGKFFPLKNPLRHVGSSLEALTSQALPISDKVAVTRIAGEALLVSDAEFQRKLERPVGPSTREFLSERLVSEVAFKRFFEPFFGGVFLEDRLETSAELFRFYLKKFASGSVFVPARGAGALSEQLAANLPPAKVRYGAKVEGLALVEGKVTALSLLGGETLPVSGVILAMDEPATRRLLSLGKPAQRHTSVVTLYFSTPQSLYPDKLLVLPAGDGRLVRHFVQITNVAPEYAPPGLHLISASVLHDRGLTDAELIERAAAEIVEVFPAAAGKLQAVGMTRVPYATVRTGGIQPTSPYPNLWLAGDQVSSSSIEAVIRSGEKAANFVTA